MSSILDALKKLEEEKAARKAVDAGSSDPETPMEKFNETPRPRRRQEEVRLSNKTVLLLGGGLAVALVAVSVTVSLALMRSTAPAQVAVAQPVAPVVVAPVAPAPVVAPEATPATPEASAPLTTAPARVEPLPQVAKAETPAPKPKVVEPKAAPAPKVVEPKVAEPEQHPLPQSFPAIAPEPEPAPEPAPAPEPTPEPEPAPADPETMDTKDVAPVGDVKELPVLRTSDRISFGLENMRVNFLREATPNRPAAMAVINLNKIHIGEVIPGTKARLVAVEREGIGIEITESGKRFYVPL
jgi:hypothetical protein